MEPGTSLLELTATAGKKARININSLFTWHCTRSDYTIWARWVYWPVGSCTWPGRPILSEWPRVLIWRCWQSCSSSAHIDQTLLRTHSLGRIWNNGNSFIKSTFYFWQYLFMKESSVTFPVPSIQIERLYWEWTSSIAWRHWAMSNYSLAIDIPGSIAPESIVNTPPPYIKRSHGDALALRWYLISSHVSLAHAIKSLSLLLADDRSTSHLSRSFTLSLFFFFYGNTLIRI